MGSGLTFRLNSPTANEITRATPQDANLDSIKLNNKAAFCPVVTIKGQEYLLSVDGLSHSRLSAISMDEWVAIARNTAAMALQIVPSDPFANLTGMEICSNSVNYRGRTVMHQGNAANIFRAISEVANGAAVTPSRASVPAPTATRAPATTKPARVPTTATRTDRTAARPKNPVIEGVPSQHVNNLMDHLDDTAKTVAGRNSLNPNEVIGYAYTLLASANPDEFPTLAIEKSSQMIAAKKIHCSDFTKTAIMYAVAERLEWYAFAALKDAVVKHVDSTIRSNPSWRAGMVISAQDRKKVIKDTKETVAGLFAATLTKQPADNIAIQRLKDQGNFNLISSVELSKLIGARIQHLKATTPAPAKSWWQFWK